MTGPENDQGHGQRLLPPTVPRVKQATGKAHRTGGPNGRDPPSSRPAGGGHEGVTVKLLVITTWVA